MGRLALEDERRARLYTVYCREELRLGDSVLSRLRESEYSCINDIEKFRREEHTPRRKRSQHRYITLRQGAKIRAELRACCAKRTVCRAYEVMVSPHVLKVSVKYMYVALPPVSIMVRRHSKH